MPGEQCPPHNTEIPSFLLAKEGQSWIFPMNILSASNFTQLFRTKETQDLYNLPKEEGTFEHRQNKLYNG